MTIIQKAPTFNLLASDLREPEPIITPAFTTAELEAMNRYCLKFRDLVRGGGTPTSEQDRRFRLYSRVTYATGMACG